MEENKNDLTEIIKEKSESLNTSIDAEEITEEYDSSIEKEMEKEQKKKNRKTVAIAAVAVLAVVGILAAIFVPKILKAKKEQKQSPALAEFSIAEFNYYYLTIYSNLISQAQQYDQMYGEGTAKEVMGFDPSVSPEKQEYSGETLEGFKDGEKATWSDYLRINAISSMRQGYAVYQEAIASGYEKTDEVQEKIDNYILTLSQAAESDETDLDSFIKQRFGSDMDEKMLRAVLERQLVASDFLQKKYDEFGENITEEEALKAFNEEPEKYSSVSLRYFGTDTEEEANEALEKITDEESFIKLAESYSYTPEDSLVASMPYENLASFLNEEDVNWLFSAERKPGDKYAAEAGGQYAVFFVLEPAHKDESRASNVRHLLYAFPTDEEGNIDMSDEEKAQLKKEAEKTLAQFKKNPSEEAFIELVKNVPSDDDASVENGGLYENITELSNYVPEFKNWAIDPERKPGDVEIVETEYGYHIMYYSSRSEKPMWMTAVEPVVQENKFTDYYNEITFKNVFGEIDEAAVAEAVKKDNQHIVDNLLQK